MPKYDSQLNDLKNSFLNARNVLVVLPANLTTDKLAAGLALMLSLKQSGKQVSIVSAGTPTVSNTNLFGIGELKNALPSVDGGGDFIITLEGVVDSNGNVPSEKLDWYAEGQNLNLVFHTGPNQQFQPNNISTKTQSGGGVVDWTFIVGASNLNDLGSLNQPNNFGQIVNIDNVSSNNNFGKINIVDSNASSLSEIVIQIIQGLGMPVETDLSSNILTGIYDATSNLTQNVKPDTFASASIAMQAGGKIPGTNPVMQPINQAQPFTIQSAEQNAPYQASPFITNAPNISYQPAPAPVTQPVTQPIVNSQPTIAAVPTSQPVTSPLTPQPLLPDSGNQGFDLSKVFNAPVGPDAMEQKANEPIAAQYSQAVNQPQNQNEEKPSSVSASQNEERPSGEFSGTHNPETSPAPDWLVPKIYKGGNVG